MSRNFVRSRALFLVLLVVLIGGVVALAMVLFPRRSPRASAASAHPRRAVRVAHEQRKPRVLRLPAVLPSRTVNLPILMYHRIDVLTETLAPITHRLTVDPADFAAQMRWLKRHGFHAVTQRQTFDALERGARLPSKPIMITFDDGYRDVFQKASPVLERLRMPATAYVITGRVGGPDPSFLTWGELRLLERRGITIGSHTVTHPDLRALSDAQALAELKNSRAALQRGLHHPVQWFAYPAGAEDARVVALVRRAGYVLAVTTKPRAVQSAAAPLELRRYEVLDSTGVRGLASLVGAVP
jgi:peptidoglycan/xylan/chitin deacetylase (PgdA/CDA1 family)